MSLKLMICVFLNCLLFYISGNAFVFRQNTRFQFKCASASGPNSPNFDGDLQFVRGDGVQVVIERFGPLGASVSINENSAFGLILQKEIALFRARRGGEDILVGEKLDGFVENVRDDGKIDITLRPVGLSRIKSLRDSVLEALEGSPSGSIPLGDKSSPEDVNSYFYGVSKRDFKNAVGALFREGIAKPDDFSLTLMTTEESKAHLEQRASQPSTPARQMKPPRLPSDRDISKSIFVGNLPFKITEELLKKSIQKAVNTDQVASVRLARDESSNLKGFGYVEFQSGDNLAETLQKLKGIEILGRALRVDYADPSRKELPAAYLSGEAVGVDGQPLSVVVRSDGTKSWQSSRDRNRVLGSVRGDRGGDRSTSSATASRGVDSVRDEGRRERTRDNDNDDNETKTYTAAPTATDTDGSPTEDKRAVFSALKRKPSANRKETDPSDFSPAQIDDILGRSGDRPSGSFNRGGPVEGRRDFDRDAGRSGDRPSGSFNRGGPVEGRRDFDRDAGRSGDRPGRDGDSERGIGRGMERRRGPVEATLFMGNLPFDITAPDLKKEIESFTSSQCVTSVRLASDQETGRMKGFAFVDFSNQAEAAKVYEGMHGKSLGGRPLNIDDATRGK
eukprot:gene4866-9694_t